MNTADQLPLAARIGWDWADGHHDLALQGAGSVRAERLRVIHTPEALQEFLVELRHRVGGRAIVKSCGSG